MRGGAGRTPLAIALAGGLGEGVVFVVTHDVPFRDKLGGQRWRLVQGQLQTDEPDGEVSAPSG